MASARRMVGAAVFMAKADSPHRTESVWKRLILSITDSSIRDVLYIPFWSMKSMANRPRPAAWFVSRASTVVVAGSTDDRNGLLEN